MYAYIGDAAFLLIVGLFFGPGDIDFFFWASNVLIFIYDICIYTYTYAATDYYLGQGIEDTPCRSRFSALGPAKFHSNSLIERAFVTSFSCSIALFFLEILSDY